MYVAVGKGTESLEFCHGHLKPDVRAGIGGCKSSLTQVYHLSIPLYSKQLNPGDMVLHCVWMWYFFPHYNMNNIGSGFSFAFTDFNNRDVLLFPLRLLVYL